MGKGVDRMVSKNEDSIILQAEKRERTKGRVPVHRRQAISRIPANHRMNEEKIIRFVESGELEIDGTGRIWRLKVRRGKRNGGTVIIDLKKKRRAEKRVPLGYLQVRSLIDEKRVHCCAHRLVWLYFNGPIQSGLCINHKNGIKDDNRPSNLEVVTYSENASHALRTGLKDQTGENNPNSKLTDSEIVEIRERFLKEEVRQVQLAKEYGISFQHVSQIVRGQIRAEVGGPTSKDNRGDFTEHDPLTGQFVRSDK